MNIMNCQHIIRSALRCKSPVAQLKHNLRLKSSIAHCTRVTGSFVDEVKKIVGKSNVSTADAVCEQHGHDESYHGVEPPDVVAFAESVDHVSKVAQLCNENGVPLIPFGSGTGLEGGVNALQKTSDIPGAILSGPEKVKPDDIDALLTVDLPESVILNIKRWWKGEISGRRCVKTILDLGVRIAAGYVGTTVGGYIPVPNGAMIGATAGKFAAEYLRNLLTKWVFDLPQSEALENALTFLNVSPNASNSEINSQYKRLARKYRPNKGGDTENWTRLQYSMAVIKEWRGNL